MKRGPEAPGFDVARDVLFVGQGASPVAYYRCFLPAMTLGCDWVGIGGEPPKAGWVTGLVGKESRMPNMLEDYKIVVLQQPAGDGWLNAIDNMREQGVVVLYEIDDYLHAIQHMKHHDFKEHFDKTYLAKVEAAMKRCDGIIASTEWIANNYRHFNKQTHICRNGIDLNRYQLTIPDRPTTNIGWAGGTGHIQAIQPWLQQVASIMRGRPDVAFVSIGQRFAEAFAQHFDPSRAIAVPFAALEQYPSAMTMIDIGLAPSGNGGWWRGKSDLRWLEAGALGIPLVADPRLYPSIEDGVTGCLASNPLEAAEQMLRLLNDKDFRTEVGANAKDVITRTRSIEVTSQDWMDVFGEVTGESA